MQGKDRQPEFWRTLEELARTPEYQDRLHREFPELASEWPDGPSRRNFLKLMSASIALAGAGAGICGCGQQQDEQIVPYVMPPEQSLPGRPMYFATAMPFCGYGKGVLVESNMGRPTKVEGNPDHPATLGASDIFMQASILDLWDPERAQTIRQSGQISTWGAFVSALNAQLASKSTGARIRILTGAVTSPTLADQIQRLIKKYPTAKWHHYEPVGSDNIRLGSKLSFNRVVQTIYHFDKAKIICSLDSDFLTDNAASLRYARQFADGRRIRASDDKTKLEMNRLYVAESTPSLTGAMGDHRVRTLARDIELLARTLAGRLGGTTFSATLSPDENTWINHLIADLRANSGANLIIAGPYQPPIVHALAHQMNQLLGNVGKTVTYHEPIEPHQSESIDSLRDLVSDINAGSVDILLILGPNPIYTAPTDFNFTQAIQKVPLRIHQSLYYDETAAYCHWHIPESHFLESWSDVRAFDGTASIIQPLISPLYQSKSAHQLLAALLGENDLAPLPIVKEYWRKKIGGENFEQVWHESLRRGVIPNTASPAVSVTANQKLPQSPAALPPAGYEIIFRPDPSIWDGRFAHNGWLQELPKPLTKLTWDNAALISPRLASDLKIKNGDIVTLMATDTSLKAPVWIMPGHPDKSVTLYLGYGRQMGNQKPGVDAYRLRTSARPWFDHSWDIIPTHETYSLACTQPHQLIESKATEDLIRISPIAKFKEELSHKKEEPHRISLSLFPAPEWDYSKGHQWAMTIDNNTCIGCNACVVACQAENNIPVVGKEEVLRSREMHWIRIDTYYQGDPTGNPQTYFEPLPCMHCETAPCEVVCPVGATTHSAEGLNEMTYNRCIGTRYCSNNCPYKVRRFNFFQYAKPDDPTYLLRSNPDVTVREQGVMEKCTYCVQRLNRTRVEIKKLEVQFSEATTDPDKQAARALMDRSMASLQTACQQACPTQAIIFGDLNWPNSEVKKLQKQPHDFGLLEELNTKPRTRYLARFTNRGGEA